MKYYINSNKQSSKNGDNYEVHKEICEFYKKNVFGNNFIYLGVFNNEIEAVQYAKDKYKSNASEIDGCAYCCPRAHTE